ncbi:Y-family DNA polymerase [Ferrimonas marina]|uniref:DNA polymerase V n=1 Tax=Ferrimonas marina TaxID=299255 RepID=A0A1M5Z569_9GAMM|nr:hypothetical protein [Ferrimonas marina]SHI19417.1 DNA polymerase V [Ferrimonas marina]
MKGLTFALIDVNSAYAQYYALTETQIRHRPIVVLSAQDGIIIAANDQARALGLRKFEPWFQQRKTLPKAQLDQVAVRSSTFEHISEASRRFHHTLGQLAPEVWPYSVDECFALYGRAQCDWLAEGQGIKQRLWSELRYPVGVGFGSTMTLSKVASHVAKRFPEFSKQQIAEVREQDRHILDRVGVEELWGVGKRTAPKLLERGIETALDLAQAPRGELRRVFGVNMERTHMELNGIACLEPGYSDHSQTICSMRSLSPSQQFCCEEQLARGLADRLACAHEKLLAQQVTVSKLSVYAATPAFNQRVTPFNHSVTVPLGLHTQDLLTLSRAVREGAAKLHKNGVLYGKIGVTLLDPTPLSHRQGDLFSRSDSEKSDALSEVLGQLHGRFGRDAVTLGRCSLGAGQEVYGSCHTPRALTRWDELALAY